MKRFLPAALALLIVSSGAILWAQSAPWIHVEIVGQNDEGRKVNVNLPLAMADVAARVLEDKIPDAQKLGLSKHEITLADLRDMWAQLRSAGDAEFVSIEEKDQTIHIAREGPDILLRIEDRESGQQKVRVQVPVSVVDALLSGDEERLNVRSALDELKTHRGEIVRVENDENHIRVWIDDGV